MKTKKRYACLVFDADHTLIKYKQDELAALVVLFKELGLEVDGEGLEFCHALSEETWTETGLYDVHDPHIQKEYHSLYRSHVKGIFEKFFKRYPCSADPVEVGKRFLQLLSVGGNLFDGAEQTLAALSDKTGGKYKVYIATNGVREIQLGRLKRLEKYCRKIFVSEDLGVIKPQKEFFASMLSEIGETPQNCLMIGDSLSSDIAGGNAAGMDTCWFNTRGHQADGSVRPTYEIERLTDLLGLA